MRQDQRQRAADQAALDAYARARSEGESPERALRVAILRWISQCDWADGREARARVREVLLRTRAMAPRDYEDWVFISSGDDIWGAGAPAAIHRLSIDCRTLDRRDGAADDHVEEAAGAETQAGDAAREEV